MNLNTKNSLSFPAFPSKILFTGAQGQDIAKIIHAQAPELELRLSTDPKDKDWNWAQAWVGDALPPNGFPPPREISWYHLTCDGINHLSNHLLPASEAGAVITHTVGQMPIYIGTWIAAYLLSEIRFHRQYLEQQQKILWKPLELRLPENYPVLILGTGEIGTGIAKILNSLGFTVTGVNTSGKTEASKLVKNGGVFTKVIPFSEIFQNLKNFKVLVSSLPLTEKTHHLVNMEILKHGSNLLFFNVGRGAVVDPNSLKTSLEIKHVEKAFLDVFESEPLTPHDWRWTHPNVIITPHISGPTLPLDASEAFLLVWKTWKNLLSSQQIPKNASLSSTNQTESLSNLSNPANSLINLEKLPLRVNIKRGY